MKKVALCVLLSVLVVVFGMKEDFRGQVVERFTYMVENLPQEKVYLHTDKSTYTTGEKIWFRAYELDAAMNSPVLYSRYVYVDLIDKRDSLLKRVKVVERDSCFYGHLEVPQDLPQGEYCLQAYTYNMQNLGDDYFFRKQIRVINPMDSRVWTDVTYRHEGGGRYTARFHLTRGKGEPYDYAEMTYQLKAKDGLKSGKRIRTDSDGYMEIGIDTTVKSIKVAFADDDLFSFEREIHVPRLGDEFDVQFFPEGGNLLAGNWQEVAFKAIGETGVGVPVEGKIYQDSVSIATVRTEHDGMGCFRIPVTGGKKYYAVLKTESGGEKRFDLPEVSRTGWGLDLTVGDEFVDYRIVCGDEASLLGDLYLVVHSRGVVLAVEPVEGKARGRIHADIVPEGVAHAFLVDSKCQVYSQRLFFRKNKERPALAVKTNRPSYASRELVRMKIGFEDMPSELREGTFSLTVTDDQKVEQDSLEDNIVSNLLLTSDIKGYVDDPGYYFRDTTKVLDRHLDLVMMTHGWTRFDVGHVAEGKYDMPTYAMEIGQVISGQVRNLLGKDTKDAQVVLVSNNGIFKELETDKDGYFMVDDIAFPEGTEFLVQALSARGRKAVNVNVDVDTFLPIRYALPMTVEQKQEEDAFLKRFSQDYYYENGQRIYVLDEVNIARRKSPKAEDFFSGISTNYLDSAKLAELIDFDITWIIQEIPGIIFERGMDGKEYLTRKGREVYILVDDMEETLEYVKTIPRKALRSVAYMGSMQASIYFGDKGRGGALFIRTDPTYRVPKLGRFNVMAFSLLGYQQPEEFYVPKYEVESVRKDNRYDTRTTIYWNPVVDIKRGEAAEVSFYTADVYGSYTVVVEGITKDGVVCRKRIKLPIR